MIGGSKFSAGVSYPDLQASLCTSCNAAADLSNYWVPQLYVRKARDGKFYYVDNDFHVYYKGAANITHQNKYLQIFANHGL